MGFVCFQAAFAFSGCLCVFRLPLRFQAAFAFSGCLIRIGSLKMQLR
ncbi:hypothetical protein [Kingella oralis]